eukprot:6201627-Pleurochrysis_carterae.AAC.1
MHLCGPVMCPLLARLGSITEDTCRADLTAFEEQCMASTPSIHPFSSPLQPLLFLRPSTSFWRLCHSDSFNMPCMHARRPSLFVHSHFLAVFIWQATGIVFTITGSSEMTLQEVNAAAEAIFEMADPEANIIFGAQIDDTMGGVLSITVVATGFGA